MLKTTPKIRFFLWKAMKNAIPIGENLKSRGINTTATCPHCGLEESVSHVFSFAICETGMGGSSVQTNSYLWSIDPFENDHGNFKKPYLLTTNGTRNWPSFPWLLWTIWTTRNKMIFESRQATSTKVISQAIVQAKEWNTAQGTLIPIPPPRLLIPNLTLNMDTIQVYSDASWRETTHTTGFGWILIYQLMEKEIQGNASASHISYPLMAEATILLPAIQHAIDLNYKTISFASDSQTLLKPINGGAHPIELHGILHDVLTLSSFSRMLDFLSLAVITIVEPV